ncbi:MAG: dTDP-4-dehydrorhamnose 3,5-epimerase [Magnetococcales bacterium]|nr:dTDP-4-dehydrorhamnose 3,5-epimerase [Magnetococcales bacterium]MBF0439102.1 dTDP-4-dehydrorhamnose 3,5-epimerase [Magnetococcales bacterium]
MNIRATAIAGVMIADTTPFADHRGAFARWFCDQKLQTILNQRSIVQINHSCTYATGAVRGLHFQHPPHAEMKLIRCLRGRVWDVAVDLRRDSPTFLQWHGEELFPENRSMLIIPEGCAHGFQVLEPDSELLYLHTAHYAPHAEGGVRPDDARLAISWPLPMADISMKDQNHPLLPLDYAGILL